MVIRMKVILASLPQKIDEHKFEPLELAPMALYLLAAVLKNAGFEVGIIDPCEFIQFESKGDLEQLCTKYILKRLGNEDADIVAFSVNSFNWANTKIIIEGIAEFLPGIKIALGGLHPTIFDDYILKTSKAHFIMRGEGEKVIVNLCNALQNNCGIGTVKGITYKDDNGTVIRNGDEELLTVEEMENSPYPAFELLPAVNPYTQLPLETSRGCYFSCAFCSIPHRKIWRGLSAEQVVNRIRHTLKFRNSIHRGTHVLFVDDCFTADGERAVKVFKKLNRMYGYTQKFFLEVRITDILKSNVLQQIPYQMISSMQIGVECGYDEGLKRIKKGLTVEQLFNALDILREYNFDKHCFLSFIIGFPWETMEMINQTLDTIEKICLTYKVICNLNWLLLLPSNLWEEKEKYGIEVDESMFDDLLWYGSSDYFFKTHPLITMEDVLQVEKRLGDMQLRGGTVAYRRRIGMEESYIEPSAIYD